MKSSVRQLITPIVFGIAACAIYFWLSRILMLDYQTKSAIKVLMFIGLPFFSWLCLQRLPLRAALLQLLPRREQLRLLLVSLIAGILIILVFNLLADPICRWFGVSGIVDEIKARTQTTRSKIILSLFYIPLVNALAEELFFRGFCFRELAAQGNRRFAYIFSAALFACYHLAVFRSWFTPLLLALALAGLFACGLFLNWMVEREDHIIGAWLLHGLVNVAIISISLQFFT